MQSIAMRLFCIASLALLMPGSLSAGDLFQPAQSYPTGGLTATSMAVGDLNQDGKPDLVVANVCAINTCDVLIGVLLGNGDGTFQAAKTYDIGIPFASSVAVADVNGDGKLDIIAINGASCGPPPCLNYAIVLLGNGDGTFAVPKLFQTTYETIAVAVADVNGDGKPDLLLESVFANADPKRNGAVAVMLGKGDGTFEAAQSYDSGSGVALSMAVGDLNGDGKPDVVLAHELGAVGVLLGNGDGSFQAAQTYLTSSEVSSIAIADVNGDGKPDLLVSNPYNVTSYPASAVGVLLGNGDGTFQAAQFFSTGARLAQSLAVADVNGDGNPDVVVVHSIQGSSSIGSRVTVLLGNGDGTFRNPVIAHSGVQRGISILMADVNGDGKPDLLVGNKCDKLIGCTSSVGVSLGTKGVQTTTSLSSSLNPSAYGDAVTFTVAVTSTGPTPTGNVKFRDGTTGIKTVTLSGGVASFTTSKLAVGTHLITAEYLGSAAGSKSTSPVLSQAVQ